MVGANIVQAEFFLANTKGTFEQLRADVVGRVCDGAPIKFTVRFFDDHHEITTLALKYQRVDLLRMISIDLATKKRSWWQRRRNNYKFQQAVRKGQDLKRGIPVIVMKRLERVIATGAPLAIEKENRSFRLADKAELHELLETVRRAHGVWVFIFEPNDLLADSNKSVAHLTF